MVMKVKGEKMNEQRQLAVEGFGSSSTRGRRDEPIFLGKIVLVI